MTCSLSPARVWGWTGVVHEVQLHVGLSPARVGMDRGPGSCAGCCGAQPHACGDGPLLKMFVVQAEYSTPRVWG